MLAQLLLVLCDFVANALLVAVRDIGVAMLMVVRAA